MAPRWGSKTNLTIVIRDNDSLAGPGLGPDAAANFRGFYNDNKALVIGAFRAFDGTARAGIARLNSDNTGLVCNAHPKFPVLLDSGDFQFSLWGYEEGAYTIDVSADF